VRLGAAARGGSSSGTSKPAQAALEPRPSAPSLGFAGKEDAALAAGRPLLGCPGLGRASI